MSSLRQLNRKCRKASDSLLKRFVSFDPLHLEIKIDLLSEAVNFELRSFVRGSGRQLQVTIIRITNDTDFTYLTHFLRIFESVLLKSLHDESSTSEFEEEK